MALTSVSTPNKDYKLVRRQLAFNRPFEVSRVLTKQVRVDYRLHNTQRPSGQPATVPSLPDAPSAKYSLDLAIEVLLVVFILRAWEAWIE